MKKLLLIAVVILGFSATSFAQLSANTTASATVKTALNITNARAMNFGSFYAPTGAAGTLTLSPEATTKLTKTDNIVTLQSDLASAQFNITGEPSAVVNVAVTYANDLKLHITSGTGTDMGLSLTSSLAGLTGSTITLSSTDGTGTIYLGGTLSVANGQAKGVYQTTPSDILVTINY